MANDAVAAHDLPQSFRAGEEPIGAVDLQAGEWVVGIECGGGGYGNPLERAPQLVLEDVLERYVSPEAARETYGVVVGDGSAVDEVATKELRESMRARRVAVTWLFDRGCDDRQA